MEFLINFLPFHSIANKWLIDMKLSPSDKAVSSTLFILVLPINTQIIFNFHFIRYWSWFSVSFTFTTLILQLYFYNFNFRLFSRMCYLHLVNKGRTLLKFIEYLKALRKIFADVSKFLHVNTKSNVKTRNENRQGNSTKERLFSVLMGPIPRGKMLYNWVSGEEFGESLVFSEGMISRIKTIS